MKEDKLKAELRKEISKRANKKLRREGLIPVNYYSKKEDNINLQINSREFVRIMKTGVHIINLEIGKKNKTALVKEIQFHPVSEDILHVDFQGVLLSDKVDVNVKLNFIGSAIGIKEGGVIEMLMHDIEIKCKAGEIPKLLDVDITNLNVGDLLFVKDLKFGDLEILSNPNAIVATVTVPKIETETQIPEEGEESEATDETDKTTETTEEEKGKE